MMIFNRSIRPERLTLLVSLGLVLGSLPLDIQIREQADSGHPTVVADPKSVAAEIYRKIGRRIAVKLAEQARDMTSKFPNIVVQNT